MARPTLFSHPKLAMLVHRLRDTVAPRALALGALELIWEAGYASGDPVVGTAEAVEALANWTGKPGELAEHLGPNGAKFLDLDGDQYVIHDLADHAPKYVAQRMLREAERKLRGTTISEIRSSAAHKRWDNAAKVVKVGPVKKPAPPPPEPPAPALGDPVVMVFHDCKGNGPEAFTVTRSFIDSHREAYPAVNLDVEFNKALVWWRANPARHKTHGGMAKFFATWLGRAQDRGGPPSFGNRGNAGEVTRASFQDWREAKGGNR